MVRKLPPDFDPERYAAEHPDVALSGLTPADHYLLFGRILGRQFTPPPMRSVDAASSGPEPKAEEPKPEQPRGDREPELTKEVPRSPEEKPHSKPVRPVGEDKPRPATERPKPIIDRPADFEPEQSLVRPAPPRPGVDKEGRIALAVLAGELPTEIAGGLASYRRMLGLAQSESPVGLGAAQLIDSAAKAENAWLTTDGVLRLMIADHGGAADGWAIRAYQADHADQAHPEQLHLLEPGALLPKRGPALVEFQTLDQLMPLLLEVSDAEGQIKELALIPFPSLLPGGIHNAELRALQSAANPMEAFWITSDLLLRELLGEADAPALSIGRLTPTGPDKGDETVHGWLRTVFGFRPSDGGANTLERSGGGVELKLPKGSIPTIGSIVSRSLSGRGTGPYLVADVETFRPRWSVVLPASWDAGGAAPMLAGGPGTVAPSLHLAIALRAPHAPALPMAPAPKKRRSKRKISVLLEATDPDRSNAVVETLQLLLGANLDLLVRPARGSNTFEPGIEGSWKRIDGDLQTAASEAKHDLLLTISDKVELVGGPVLDTLTAMLEQESVASASCVLLREVSFKKQKVLQSATGGLFPAGVSFAAAPSLTFAEPDVLEALPDSIYPVVANTLHLTLWRRNALAGLPKPARPLPASATHIQIGLALAERGLVSLCTTRVSARLHGDYAPRDAIDPIGQSRLTPSDWQQLLGRVTLLRQLF
jgi:hypothetical protein